MWGNAKEGIGMHGLELILVPELNTFWVLSYLILGAALFARFFFFYPDITNEETKS